MTALKWAPPRLSGDERTAFIDSAAMDLFVDVSAAAPATVLALAFGAAGSKWASFFWAVAGIAGFKGLVDLSRLVDQGKGE